MANCVVRSSLNVVSMCLGDCENSTRLYSQTKWSVPPWIQYCEKKKCKCNASFVLANLRRKINKLSKEISLGSLWKTSELRSIFASANFRSKFAWNVNSLFFRRKAKKSWEFRQISFAFLLHNTVLYINELIIWKLNLFIHFNNAGIMHSFFKYLDQKSISACLLPNRLYCCYPFQQNLCNFYNCFQCSYISAYIFGLTRQPRRIKIHLNHSPLAWPLNLCKFA